MYVKRADRVWQDETSLSSPLHVLVSYHLNGYSLINKTIGYHLYYDYGDCYI